MTGLLLVVALAVAGLLLLTAGARLEARKLRTTRTRAAHAAPEVRVIDAVLAPNQAGPGSELWVCPNPEPAGGGRGA